MTLEEARDRYDKLVRMSTDPSASPNERAQAERLAGKLKEAYPGIDTPVPPSASATSFIDHLVSQLGPQVAPFARDLGQRAMQAARERLINEASQVFAETDALIERFRKGEPMFPDDDNDSEEIDLDSASFDACVKSTLEVEEVEEDPYDVGYIYVTLVLHEDVLARAAEDSDMAVAFCTHLLAEIQD